MGMSTNNFFQHFSITPFPTPYKDQTIINIHHNSLIFIRSRKRSDGKVLEEIVCGHRNMNDNVRRGYLNIKIREVIENFTIREKRFQIVQVCSFIQDPYQFIYRN